MERYLSAMSEHHTPDACDTGQRPLWAPWRIDYIRSPKPDGCFLCDKAGERTADEKNHVIARSDTCFLLLNDYPYNSGHVMVAPYRHVADLCDLTGSEQRELMDLIARVKCVISELMKPEGFNIGFNLGAAAGAGVLDHIHGHIVPRWIGDTNFMPVLSGSRVVPEALVETARILRDAWNSGS